MEQIQQLQCGASSQTSPFTVGTLSAPFIVDGIVEQWPSRQWTIDTLAQALGNKTLRCRLMQREQEQRGGPAWEAEGVYVECQLHQFSSWCCGEAGEDNPLCPFSPRDFTGYIDYKYMSELFADQPHMLKEVQWSALGLADRDGKDSTIWFGSAGASTPCHYDTYGFNLVVQIQGRKRWVLFPPEQSGELYPTRVPYEESSVFSQVDLASPDLDRFPRFRNTRPIVITLEAGQVLYVPRHWWHYVTCTETAVSINTWVDVPEDRDSRVQEAVTRLLASSLIPYLAQTAGTKEEDFWVNPTEELEGAVCNVQYLKAALYSVSPPLTAGRTAMSTDHQPLAMPHSKGTSPTLSPASERTHTHNSSGVMTTQTTACHSASEHQEYFLHQPEDELEKSSDLKPSVESRDGEACSLGIFHLSASHRLVARMLQGTTVYTVDSPFSVSELQKRRLRSVMLRLPKCYDPSLEETENQDTHTGTLKRKHTDCESHDSLDHKKVKTSGLCSTINKSCDMDSETITDANLAVQEQKCICSCENKGSANARNSPHFTELETREMEISLQHVSSQISIYAPRPCHFQCYINLLQQEDFKESDELSDEDGDKDKQNVRSCSMSRNSGCDETPSIQEALLKSVLHPDVVKLIVSKMMEQV